MTTDLEARAPRSQTEPTEPAEPVRAPAPQGETADQSLADERDGLPRCCEGWIAEQVHSWAHT